HQLELAIQKRQTRGDLIVLRQPILWRPAFHDVADEHVIPRELDGFEDLREQFARSADEWTSGLVFRATGPFPDHDQPGIRRSLARDGVGAPFAQLAPLAGGDEDGDILEATRLLDRIGGEQVRGWRIEGKTRRRDLGVRRLNDGWSGRWRFPSSRLLTPGSGVVGKDHRITTKQPLLSQVFS